MDSETVRSLTPLEAFDAMLRYLKMHADKTHDDGIQMLYGWARYDALTKTGYPMSRDPREYNEWLDCVDAVLESKPERPHQ